MNKKQVATIVAAGSIIGGAAGSLASNAVKTTPTGGRGGDTRYQDASPIVDGEYPYTIQMDVQFGTENTRRQVTLPPLPEGTDRVLIEMSAAADLPIIGSTGDPVIFLAMLGGSRIRNVANGDSVGSVRLSTGGTTMLLGDGPPGTSEGYGAIEVPAWDPGNWQVILTAEDSVGLVSSGGEIDGRWIVTTTITPIDLDID